MKALLLVAHGSRRQTSNDEIRAVAVRLAAEAADRFDQVNCAFLELADPSIPEGIQQCVQAGMTEVVVVPYFLSAGRHVVEDIPAEVDKGRRQNPGIDIRITRHLGAAEGICNMLTTLAKYP